jgi:glycosyltransferase involved in cell wall biosynthesis
MGYLGTMLPKYLARLGQEVHYVATDLPPYWQVPSMRLKYSELIGAEWMRPGIHREYDGYMVHILGHRHVGGLIGMRGLRPLLKALRPDVVYALGAIGILPLECALHRALHGGLLFTGSHTLASGFPLANQLRPWLSMAGLRTFFSRWLPGRLISLWTEKCYAPTIDCASIAHRFFGVQEDKITVLHLGVDTDVFFPVRDGTSQNERRQSRIELGFSDDEIVFVYTGKLTPEKNVALLAEAVNQLREEGRSLQLLCVGAGPERDRLAAYKATKVLDFRPYTDLGRIYRAADVAVWPTNESTSMLDAAACGLPIIISDSVVYREHVDGNGLVYRMNDILDLKEKLREMSDPLTRRSLGDAGARKMANEFSWLEHARRRLHDFQAAVSVKESQLSR